MDCNVLHLYSELLENLKKSVIDNFKKAEINLIEVINLHVSSSSSCDLPEKKHELNLIIMDVLAQYSNINLNLEKIVKKLQAELDKWKDGCSSKIQNMCVPYRSTNPFEVETNSFDDFAANVISKIDNLNKLDASEPLQEIFDTSSDGTLIPDTIEIEDEQEKAVKDETKEQPENDNVPQTKQEVLKTDADIKNEEISESVLTVPEELLEPTSSYKETVEEKLKKMCINDRIAEANKKYERNLLPENFGFVTIDPASKKMNVHLNKRKPVTYTLLDQELDLNATCTVVYAENPSSFYITTDTNILNELHVALNEDYNKSVFRVVSGHKSKNRAKNILGNYGVAYLLEKQQWYRVQILDWLISTPENDLQEKVLVRLVDYGEQCFLPFKYIHSLNKVYSNFPKMAIKCQLAGLLPINKYSVNSWSTEAINEFKTLVANQTFVIIYCHKETDSYAVDLCSKDLDNETTLSEILVAKNLARQNFDVAQPQTSIFPEDDVDEFENCDNINEAITGYDAQDEAIVCPFTKRGGCYKGARCKLKHVELLPTGVTTDTELAARTAFAERKLPEVGSYITIFITECFSVTDFYGQIVVNDISNQFNEDFFKLFQVMNSDVYISTYIRYKKFPSDGAFIIVKYANTYFRAMVLHYLNDKEVPVFLVDIGSTVNVPFSDVFYMKEDFLHLPNQCYRFYLKSCRQKTGLDKEAVKQFIDQTLSFKHFQGLVCSGTEPIVVELWDSNNMDMSYILDQMAFVETNAEHIHPAIDHYVQLH